MNFKERKTTAKINKLKKRLLNSCVTDPEIAKLLMKNVTDFINFQYALALSCDIINKERINQFKLIACDPNLLKSKYYKEALEVFTSYKNPDESKEIRLILCTTSLINSPCYNLILNFLSNNKNLNYTTKVINNILLDNIELITPAFLNKLFNFKESTINEINSIMTNPLIDSQKVLDVITKLCSQKDNIDIEKHVEQILVLMRKIIFLEDKQIIDKLLNILDIEVSKQLKNINQDFVINFENKLSEQRMEIAKRKKLVS